MNNLPIDADARAGARRSPSSFLLRHTAQRLLIKGIEKKNTKELSKRSNTSEPRALQLSGSWANVSLKLLAKDYGEQAAITEYHRLRKINDITGPHGVWIRHLEFAWNFWDRLVENLGNGRATRMMHLVINRGKQAGKIPHARNIYSYLVLWGRKSRIAQLQCVCWLTTRITCDVSQACVVSQTNGLPRICL